MAPLVVAAMIDGAMLDPLEVALAPGLAVAPVVLAGAVTDEAVGAAADELLWLKALQAVMAGTRATAATAAAARRARRPALGYEWELMARHDRRSRSQPNPHRYHRTISGIVQESRPRRAPGRASMMRGAMKSASGVKARLWRAARPLQWRLVWLSNAKFVCGVTGVVRTEDGQVLLLRHRIWPPGQQWGFPSGYALSGETHERTVSREVFEETGLTVTVGQLLRVRTGFRRRVEFYYAAALAGGLDGLALEAAEILEARLFTLEDLPREMPPVHRELALATIG